MSVGFLHTPNFAAFWPKPRKKKGFWDNVLVSCKQFSTLPPPCRCQAPVQNRKKNIEKRFWGNVLVSCTQFSTLPPLQMSGSCPKTEKTSRNRKILSKTKKNLEKSKKKTKNQRFWDNVLVSCKHSVGQIGFFGFFRFLEVSFGFGQNLSISRCFC